MTKKKKSRFTSAQLTSQINQHIQNLATLTDAT
ncbi:hypothetical protein LCGC14_2001950, partial [marine sediment metagenome]